MARSRSRRPAAGVRERHPVGAVLRGALRRSRGGDRSVGGLQAVRWRDGRSHSRADGAAAAYGGDGGRLRDGVRAAHARGGTGALPGDAGRRPRGRHLAARRREGQPDRPDQRAGEGSPQPGRAGLRAHPGDGGVHRGRPRHRCRLRHRRRVRRDRGGVRRQLRGPVGEGGRRHGRRDRAAPLCRALLRRHRTVRRRAPRPSGAARPRRLHLLQGGGRRARRRRVRARGEAVGLAARAAPPVRVPAPRRGLGALLDPDGQRGAAGAGARAHRDPQVLQRSRVVHPGQPVHPGRGARGRELLRRRGVQLRGDRVGGWGRPRAGGVDRRGGADQRPDHRGHPPVRAVQRQRPLAARPRGGGARPALRDPVAQPGDAHGATLPSIAGAPPAGRGERQLRQPDGLGAGQLLRPCRGDPDHRLLLGQAELAALVGRRADQHPHRRHGLRPDVVLEVPPPRTGRRARRCSGCAPPTSTCPSGGRSTRGCSTHAGPTSPT